MESAPSCDFVASTIFATVPVPSRNYTIDLLIFSNKIAQHYDC